MNNNVQIFVFIPVGFNEMVSSAKGSNAKFGSIKVNRGTVNTIQRKIKNGGKFKRYRLIIF